jgi:hypothetical protein
VNAVNAPAPQIGVLKAKLRFRGLVNLFRPYLLAGGGRQELPRDVMSRRAVSRWVTQYQHDEWNAFMAAHSDDGQWPPGPAGICLPWLVHTDIDKYHRCPVCHTMAGIRAQMEATGGYIRNRHVYTCSEFHHDDNGEIIPDWYPCGQRFSRRWYLPGYPSNGDGFRNRLRVLWFRRYQLNPQNRLWYWHTRARIRKALTHRKERK